jgi:hypothetical protein
MTYIIVPMQGILILLLNLMAPIIVLLCLPFIRWDGYASAGPQRTNPPVPTEMGDWPTWLAWLRTPDQRLPGDTGIPEIRDMVAKCGKLCTSFVWAGLRNPLMGLACWLGKPTIGYIPENVEGLWKRGDVWIYRKSLGKLRIYAGYTAYRLLDGSFHAAPIFTLKKV